MVAITYEELLHRVTMWPNAGNNDVGAEADRLIGQAHNQIVDLLDHDLFQTDLTRLVGADGLLDLSAEDPRVLEVRSLQVAYLSEGRVPLERRSEEMLRALYPLPGVGRPRFYSQEGQTLRYRIFPHPVTTTTVTVMANVEPPVLSPTTSQNVISTQAPRALENSVYHKVCVFMKEYEAADIYATEMMAAVAEANGAMLKRRRDESDQRPRDTANRSGV